MRRTGLICLALAVITLGLYVPVIRTGPAEVRYDFVNYDDPDYVTSNSHVQSGLTKESVVWALTTGHASNWHPVTWLSHMLDCQLYGLNPTGHHLTNVLLHIANALLLFGVLRQMTGSTWCSAGVAAVFAWHPLHVESVAWVSERKDVLSAFFWLLTMGAYLKYVRASQSAMAHPPGRKLKVFYGLTLLSFMLGLMSKPMLVTLPFVLLLLDYWPLNRAAEPAAQGVAKKGGKLQLRTWTWMELALEKVPLLLLAIASSVVTFLVQTKGGAVSSLSNLSVSARLANALVSYLRYVGKLLWPRNLSILYPHPGSWPMWLVVAAGLLLVGVTVGVMLQARSRPYLLVGWLWFVGTLVPVIGLVQVGVQSMADRYTYIPAIGLLIMICWGLPDLLARWPERNRELACVGGMALAGCVMMTVVQLGHWRNSEQLFRHAVKVTDNNYLAYNNLGFFLDHEGKGDEAMVNYRKSLEINPNYEEAQNNMGYALAGKGRYAEAIPYYETALRLRPKLVEAHNNLGNALGELGRVNEAIAEYQIALQLNPDHADAHNNFGIALAMQGKLDEAVQHLQEAVRLKPSYASAHSNLGNALAVQHKLDEAVTHYQIALQLKPDDAQAHNNLGNVLSEQGKLDEATAHYHKALQLKADNPEAHYNLGMVLLRQNKREDALKHFREAARLKPNYTEANRQIAALGELP
jgi:tetratricopeptide (TPR) repeat protein